MILGLDPGPTRSALVQVEPVRLAMPRVVWSDLAENDLILEWLRVNAYDGAGELVVEEVESFGMPVGREVFQTVYWAGRFAEAWDREGGKVVLLPRRVVKSWLCNSARATDATVRQALLDRYGPGRAAAVGTKRQPGPLYGMRRDLWSALALAVTVAEQG